MSHFRSVSFAAFKRDRWRRWYVSCPTSALPDNGPSAGTFQRGREGEGEGIVSDASVFQLPGPAHGPWAARRAKWKRRDLYFRMSNPTGAPDVNAQVPPRKPEQAVKRRLPRDETSGFSRYSCSYPPPHHHPPVPVSTRELLNFHPALKHTDKRLSFGMALMQNMK